MSALVIRDAVIADAPTICTIYNPYIESTIITFEEQPVTVQEMESRIQAVADASFPWLVCEKDGEVIGYSYASKWHGRCAYRFSVEGTVYLKQKCFGQGIGSALYSQVIERLRDQSIHCIVGGIALPNPASIALHEKLGFKKVAHFPEVGWKFNQWIDVGYWELILGQPETGDL
jgi:L-amino acid N-acyltransferase YncA